jgi:hypothetical protein
MAANAGLVLISNAAKARTGLKNHALTILKFCLIAVDSSTRNDFGDTNTA